MNPSPKHKMETKTQKPCVNENTLMHKHCKINKTPCVLEFQITKSDLKSQILGLYPKHEIFETLFTLELVPR
jgi:hypothetical protein